MGQAIDRESRRTGQPVYTYDDSDSLTDIAVTDSVYQLDAVGNRTLEQIKDVTER